MVNHSGDIRNSIVGQCAQGATHTALNNSECRSNTLMPKVDYPFFIVTPPYTRMSAGVTVLYLLCHYLNLVGEAAFIVQWPPLQTALRSLPYYVTLQAQGEFPGGMLAPMITQDVLDFYDDREMTPIVVYPEVFDNPLKARFYGRYILNYPGKLAPEYREREKFGLAYTRALADRCTELYPHHPKIRDVLFVPTSDLDFWNRKGAGLRRSGTCYYAGKMKTILGKTPADIPTGAVEIMRSEHMRREQVREIFWRSEAFYCYEDTALAIEAQLCGCPTIFVPNEQFSGRPLAFNELGTDGWCMGMDAGSFERARATVHEVEVRIRCHIAAVPERIRRLAEKWKDMVREEGYQGGIVYPFEPRLVLFSQTQFPQAGIPEEDGLGTDNITVAQLHRRGRLSTMALTARALVIETWRRNGLRGVVARSLKGLWRHGPIGFIRCLCGILPSGM